MAADDAPDAWRATISGLCASLIGIGLARFAYTPLLPALIDQGWFGASAAAYLGATNLAGYLLGVIVAGPLARRTKAHWALRTAMLLAALSFFACAWRLGFAWFFLWRLVSGVSGGIAMILAAPTILPHVKPSRRGLVSGIIFMGVGLGVAASGTLVPLLLRSGLAQAWIGLGVLALILAIVGWSGWPKQAAPSTGTATLHAHRAPVRRALAFVTASYALNAFGLVPHMLFLVAYVAHGLGQGLDAGTHYWVLFGAGAITGPVILGHLADRIGTRSAFRVVLGIELMFVLLPALSTNTALLIASSFVVGGCTTGVVPVVLGRTQAILRHHPAAQPGAWRNATTGFALLQAVGAYALSAVFSATNGNYPLLFLLGAGAMGAALSIDLLAPAGEAQEPVTT